MAALGPWTGPEDWSEIAAKLLLLGPIILAVGLILAGYSYWEVSADSSGRLLLLVLSASVVAIGIGSLLGAVGYRIARRNRPD